MSLLFDPPMLVASSVERPQENRNAAVAGIRVTWATFSVARGADHDGGQLDTVGAFR